MDKANTIECQLRREIDSLEMRLAAQENDGKSQLRRSKDAEQRLKEVQQAWEMSLNENRAKQEASNELELQLRRQIENLVKQIHAMKEYADKKLYENRILIGNLQKELTEAALKLNKSDDLAKSTYTSWKQCAAEVEKLRQELYVCQRNCKEKEDQCLKYYGEMTKYKHELDESRKRNNELGRNAELERQLLNSEGQISQLQKKLMEYEAEISALKAEKRGNAMAKEQQMQKRCPYESGQELNAPKRRCPSTGNVTEVCDTDWDFRDCLGTSAINQNWENFVLIDSFEESGIVSNGVDSSVEQSDLNSTANVDSTRKKETFQLKNISAFDS
ncbi:hypothetical protein Ddc_00049 [Ditylenchus destructor]|nr:hypothetical protein Ddc_00049 [Ditylenchus destructor]